MASLLPGELSYQSSHEGEYRLSQEKSEGGGQWYFSRKEIEENSPSRHDGVDWKKETYIRKSYCTFLQDLGMRLKVPQVTIATSIIFCHRFFLRQSHSKNDRRTIATVCMFLAGKVEETPRPLKDVILVSYEIIHKKDSTAVQRIKQKEIYEQQKDLILLGERVVLATLGFDFNVHHPYKPLVEAIKKFKVAQNALAQVAWNFVNDGLRTSLCLQFKPHHIAAGAIFLAAKFLKVKLPSDGEKVWWQEFDVTPRQLEEVSNQMLELYEQNKLPPSQGSGVEGSTAECPAQQAPSKSLPAGEDNTTANSSHQATHLISCNNTTKLYDNNHVGPGPTRATQSQCNGALDHTPRDDQNSENVSDSSHTSRISLDGVGEGKSKRNKSVETVDLRDRHNGRSFERQNALGQSPPEAIKMLDKDKLKAAVKQRKLRGDIMRKTDLMDDDDLIERELEEGIELASANENVKKQQPYRAPDVNVVEGEVSTFNEGYTSSKTNRKRNRTAQIGYLDSDHKRHVQENPI